jgi:hypothetical protein
MTRRQKKHDKLVTLYYHSGVLSARRRPKVTYMQLIPNFLKMIQCTFSKQSKIN